MLRNSRIRSKILAALAIPVFLLLALAGGLIVSSVDQRATANGSREGLQLSTEYSDAVRALQEERALTHAVLSGDTTRNSDLAELRTRTSFALEELSDSTAGTALASAAVTTSWQRALDVGQELPQLRASVDDGSLTAGQAFRAYTEGISQMSRIPAALSAALRPPAAQDAMLTLAANERAIEALAVEENTLGTVIQAGGIRTAEEGTAVQGAIVARSFTYGQAQENATVQDVELADVSADLAAIENQMAGLAVDEAPSTTVAALQAAVNAETAKLSDVTEEVLGPALEAVQTEVAAANRAMLLTVLAALAVLALMAALARAITSELSGPLQRLTESASRIRDQLPMLVDRDRPDQRVALSEDMIVEVESDDEVGRLALAFNDVNRAVVAHANQQAELRSSIAGMFVNVARRDQTLLSRQLALIDQLERTEEDPQTLSTLFKLDHLSTRMRRNAEALLVLAGIDTGRWLRQPMALSDVVRTASSEIEHYDRVDLVQIVDPQMLGHTALTAASLLAELLENATSFSDPNSRVSARTENSPKGIAVIITDEGLGMSEADVAEANEKVASASLAEVVASKRLGLFVVGRLARRLEATVTVSRGATKGITVHVDFPPSVFLPGAVTHVAEPGKQGAGRDESAQDKAADPSGAPRPDASRPAGSAGSRLARRPSSPAARRGDQPSSADSVPAQPSPRRTGVPSQAKPKALSPDASAAPPANPDAEVGMSQPRSAEARAPKPAGPSKGLPLARRDTAQRDKTGTPQPRRERETAKPTRGETAPQTQPATGAQYEPTGTQAADRAVPGPRDGAQPRPAQRSGLFGSFRSRPEDSAAAASEEAAPPSQSGDLGAARTSAPNAAAPLPSRAARRANNATQSEHEQAGLSNAEHAPAETHHGPTVDILPGRNTTRRASGRGGSLFGRLGESQPRPESTFQSPTADQTSGSSTPAPAAASAAVEPELATTPPGPVDDPRRALSAPAVEVAAHNPVPEAPAEAARSLRRDSGKDSGRDSGKDSGRDSGKDSGFAAEALTELSRLQTYRPSTVAAEGSAGAPTALARRQAGATPAGKLPPRPQASGQRRNRTAADVRSMLSGFQAGVERGRTNAGQPGGVEESST